MPRPLLYGLIFLVALSLIPLALVARARTAVSSKPRLHVVPDMDSQAKFKAQSGSTLFADGRAMRAPEPGTIARGDQAEEDAFHRGMEGKEFLDAFPGRLAVDEAFIRRGRDRYDIYCSPCHGLSGYGDGVVARRADELQEGTWTPPSSLHDETVRGRQVGHIFHTITSGIRNMPAYGPQIPVRDRWAIVAYVRALQRSQHAAMDDVPAAQRQNLR